MSTADSKYYAVTMEISWMDGGTCCDATLTMRLHAKSKGHAVSRAKDRLQQIGMHTVVDATAVEETQS